MIISKRITEAMRKRFGTVEYVDKPIQISRFGKKKVLYWEKLRSIVSENDTPVFCHKNKLYTDGEICEATFECGDSKLDIKMIRTVRTVVDENGIGYIYLVEE